MSEQTQQETGQGSNEPKPETVALATYDVSQLDDFGRQFVERTTSQVEKANKLAADIKANSADVKEIESGIHESLKSAELPEGLKDKRITKELLAEYDNIVKREVELDMLFRAVAKEYAEKKAAESVDQEKLATLTTEYDALVKKIKAGRNMLATEFPGAETLLPNLAGTKSGSTGTGRGAGGKKMRGFTVTVDGSVAELNGKSSFAAGAQKLGIPTPELQAAYFQAVGTDDVEKLPATAEFTVTGKDDKEHTVTAVKNA